MKTAANRDLLPASFYHPLHLLWIAVLPLTVLLAINCHGAWFVWDEITNPNDKLYLRCSLTLTAVFPLFILGVACRQWFRRRPLTMRWHLPLLILAGAFIWGNLWLLEKSAPPALAVPQWIFDYDTLFAAQFALVMPLCFYTLLGLACAPLPLTPARDVILSVLLLAVPTLGFLAGIAFFQLTHHVCLIVVLLIGSALTMLGLLRLLTRGYLWLNRFPWALVTVSALLMPLGGLALNIGIPFPVSFQTTGVYAWTLVNATLLLLGCVPRLRNIPALWLAQMATFPFTLYFFAVFLPSTALFMVHGQRLIEGCRHSAAELGKPLTVTLGAAALLALPGWIATQAALDRAALEKLNNYQAGAYLPILSNFYNWSVFDNLFLPDRKLEEMHFAFSGAALPAADTDKFMTRGIFSLTNREARNSDARRPIEFPRDKITTASDVATRADGDCVRATLTLTVTNHADTQNEYVARLRLGPAVMVSGLRLVINGEPVDGRLFEQKTALWVYHQIRDRQRRDPALLRYTAADEIELRLFPLERQQTREVAIEFLYPQNAPVFIQLNGSDILPVKRESTPPLLVTKFSADRAMLLPNPRPYLSLMPPTSPMPTRQGYWHFIIERTAADADQTAAQLLEKIRAFIGGRELDCKVTLANYESRPLTMTPVPVAKLPEILTDAALKKFPARGGFLRDKALREELFAHEAAMRRDEPRTFLNYPLPVTVSGSGVSAGPAPALSRSAVIIGVGEKITVLNKYERAFIPADGELEFYHQSDPDHPPQFTRVPSDQIGLVENPAYQLGAQVFALQDELDRHPQRTEQLLPLLVKLSKQSGIMAPATAYIVVESGEQWKILSEKERQKLAANQSLELEADIVPEPAAWSLLVIGLGLTVSVSLFAPRKAS